MNRLLRQFMKCLVLVLIAGNVLAALTLPALAGEGGEAASPQGGGASAGSGNALAVAIVVGVSSLAAGYAVGRVGSAAVGAVSERPEIFGRALVFVGLAEGIAIYGLIIGILLIVL